MEAFGGEPMRVLSLPNIEAIYLKLLHFLLHFRFNRVDDMYCSLNITFILCLTNKIYETEVLILKIKNYWNASC